jgi:hypothetical protein
MTDTSTRSSGVRRGLRRAGALTAAAGLLLVGVLMAGPAVAASAAEPATPVAVSEVVEPDAIVPEVGPVTDEAIVPIAEETAVEPIAEVIETVTRPLGLTIFVVSALTLGAGAIVAARLISHNRQRVPVRVSARRDGEE